ncbi:hypothetical protein EBZ80_19795 [bacterium]|nr:hypothetical protein [bacterium]
MTALSQDCWHCIFDFCSLYDVVIKMRVAGSSHVSSYLAHAGAWRGQTDELEQLGRQWRASVRLLHGFSTQSLFSQPHTLSRMIFYLSELFDRGCFPFLHDERGSRHEPPGRLTRLLKAEWEGFARSLLRGLKVKAIGARRIDTHSSWK